MAPDQLEQHLRELLEPLFPAGADITYQRTVDRAILRIHWLLNTDPARPSKPSRMINLVISEEAISDYLLSRFTEGADERLVAIVRARLSRFQSEHDSPPERVPTEEWLITSKDLASGTGDQAVLATNAT